MTRSLGEHQRILSGHARGDLVKVDWFDGNGPVDEACVVDVVDGVLYLRFTAERQDRPFEPVTPEVGTYRSRGGQIVEISR